MRAVFNVEHTHNIFFSLLGVFRRISRAKKNEYARFGERCVMTVYAVARQLREKFKCTRHFFCVGWHCCCCCRCCRHCNSCTLLLHSIMLFLLPSPAAMMFAVYSCKMNVNLYKLSQTHTERETEKPTAFSRSIKEKPSAFIFYCMNFTAFTQTTVATIVFY